MTLNEYQLEAKKTAIFPKEAAFEYLTLGLMGEAGEIANKYKKVIRDNNGELDNERRKELIDECGDVLWYLANLASQLNIDMGSIGALNIKKLMDRQKRDKLKGSGDQR